MATLYEELQTAGSDQERRAITNKVMDAMRLNPDDNGANEAYFTLCNGVIGRFGLGQSGRVGSRTSHLFRGEFSPLASALLVLTPPRVSGFLGAINRLGNINSAVEAGPGASAIFSVAAAKAGAQVVAFEINGSAAQCAEEVVRLTGYAGQIEIRTGDILAADIPHADAAIAEILGPGLRGENGPAVIAALKSCATHVIPDAAKLYATDVGSGYREHEYWLEVADVDLTAPDKRVSGRFESTGSGTRNLRVRADIYAQGRPIVAGAGTDDLTGPISIGSQFNVPHHGATIEFAYDIGLTPPAVPDYVNVQG